MKSTVIIASTLLAFSTTCVQAQQPLTNRVTSELYMAILRDIPAEFADRAVVLDPRISASALRTASPVEVWEHGLPQATASTVVQNLKQRVESLRYCAEVPARSKCLTSAKDVHVMFGAPMPTQSGATVEVTFAARLSDAGASFGIQTWEYTFDLTPEGVAPGGKVLLVRGHGVIRQE